MGKYQRAAMWGVGILLTLGFLGDVVEFFFVERPARINWLTELLWILLFLATLAAVEGILWLVFRTYNRSIRA